MVTPVSTWTITLLTMDDVKATQQEGTKPTVSNRNDNKCRCWHKNDSSQRIWKILVGLGIASVWTDRLLLNTDNYSDDKKRRPDYCIGGPADILHNLNSCGFNVIIV